MSDAKLARPIPERLVTRNLSKITGTKTTTYAMPFGIRKVADLFGDCRRFRRQSHDSREAIGVKDGIEKVGKRFTVLPKIRLEAGRNVRLSRNINRFARRKSLLRYW